MLSDEDDAVDLGFAVDLLIADRERESWACRHFLETFEWVPLNRNPLFE